MCALYTGLNGWTSTAQKMSVSDKDRKNAATSPAKIICSVKKRNNWGKIYCVWLEGSRQDVKLFRGEDLCWGALRLSDTASLWHSLWHFWEMLVFNGCTFFRSSLCLHLCEYVVGCMLAHTEGVVPTNKLEWLHPCPVSNSDPRDLRMVWTLCLVSRVNFPQSWQRAPCKK